MKSEPKTETQEGRLVPEVTEDKENYSKLRSRRALRQMLGFLCISFMAALIFGVVFVVWYRVSLT